MSNPARRRGRGGRGGRGGNTQPQSGSASGRGGGVAPGPYDGSTSPRGASSNSRSPGRAPSNPPSATLPPGSAVASPVTSPHSAQSGSFALASGPPSAVGGPASPRTDPARDPARQARLTDSLRNVDLPASFYNMDNLVRCLLEVLVLSSCSNIPSLFILPNDKSPALTSEFNIAHLP